MNRFFVFILTALVVLLGCSGPKKSSISENKEFSRELLELKEYFQIPGLSVLVQKDGHTIYEDYLGMADVELQIPMDSITTFQMASLTKMFSALIIMQLVEEGKISLDEPIGNYMKEVSIGDSIKIKHALSHTSQGQLGKHFYYNNNRFMLLGRVIEKASGKDFQTNVYERIINPLGLKNTYLLKDSLQIVSENRKVAMPYFLGGQSKEGYMTKEPKIGFIDYGYSTAAGISSNVRDLCKLSVALDNNVLIEEFSKNKMYSPFNQGLPYGLGVFTQEFMDEKVIWGYGQYDCYSSLFLKVPRQGLTFVIAANNNLMSDPARLIAGDVTYSLFALSFFKNFVPNLENKSLFENHASLQGIQNRLTQSNTEFYRKKLLAQSLAASFMCRYDEKECEMGKLILKEVFNHFPDYLEYGDLVLMRNIYMLKFMDDARGKAEFTDFDSQFIKLGVTFLKEDNNNPYANYYLANYFQIKGQQEKSLRYYKNIVGAENFSPWWYTSEAKKWVEEYESKN